MISERSRLRLSARNFLRLNRRRLNLHRVRNLNSQERRIFINAYCHAFSTYDENSIRAEQILRYLLLNLGRNRTIELSVLISNYIINNDDF